MWPEAERAKIVAIMKELKADFHGVLNSETGEMQFPVGLDKRGDFIYYAAPAANIRNLDDAEAFASAVRHWCKSGKRF